MVLQAAGHLSGKRAGMADQHQQDVNDQLRLKGGGQQGRLAVGEALADSGEQEGAYGDVK